jgi:hypothetical protein
VLPFMLFPQNLLPTMFCCQNVLLIMLYPWMCCYSFFSPEFAVNHGFLQNVLKIMVFPRMCSQSCFSPIICC